MKVAHIHVFLQDQEAAGLQKEGESVALLLGLRSRILQREKAHTVGKKIIYNTGCPGPDSSFNKATSDEHQPGSLPTFKRGGEETLLWSRGY